MDSDAEIEGRFNDLLFCGSHNGGKKFSGFPRLQPGDFCCQTSGSA
ncbi:hypothetical protein SynA18461_01302 [Synechococcus sp. A18-46.1]|nr:hypothetical protein SynA18461_01302 [Synechococcus sp. A18-46.1]